MSSENGRHVESWHKTSFGRFCLTLCGYIGNRYRHEHGNQRNVLCLKMFNAIVPHHQDRWAWPRTDGSVLGRCSTLQLPDKMEYVGLNPRLIPYESLAEAAIARHDRGEQPYSPDVGANCSGLRLSDD
jgi:hypothetical protein